MAASMERSRWLAGASQVESAVPLPSGQERLAGVVGGVGPATGLWVTGGAAVGVVPPPQAPIESVTRATTATRTKASRRSVMKPSKRSPSKGLSVTGALRPVNDFLIPRAEVYPTRFLERVESGPLMFAVLTQQVAHHGSEGFGGQAVGLLVGMAVHGVDPERRARLTAEERQQVVVRDPLLQAEARDCLVGGGEGVRALEGHEERPGGHEQPRALAGGPPVHLPQVALRALPALAVAVAPHVEVPARGLAADPVGFDPVRHEVEHPRAEEAGRGRHRVVLLACAVDDPVVDVALPGVEGLGL